MCVKECFHTHVEKKLAGILYSTRDILSNKTSKEPKIPQVVVRFYRTTFQVVQIVIFSKLLIKFLRKYN